jgi:hypothetical protein
MASTPDVIRMEGGCITSAKRTHAGGLTVYSTFLAEGPLIYQQSGGKREAEYLSWESITDPESLATAPGSTITYGHPNRRNKAVMRGEWGVFGKGMTSLPIYLHKPFAVIACHIGDSELADRIEQGEVTKVSSCRSTTTLRGADGKLYQGKWTQNHLAFLPKGINPRQQFAKIHLQGGDVSKLVWRADSDEEDFPLPDYSKFTPVTLANGLVVGIPPDPEESTNNRSIILLPPTIKFDQEDPNMADKTTTTTDTSAIDAEALAASVAKAVGDVMAPLMAQVVAAVGVVGDGVAAIRADSTATAPVEPAETFTAADIAAAAADGERKGTLLTIAGKVLKPEEIVGLADKTVADISRAVIASVSPSYPISASASDAELAGAAMALGRSVPEVEPAKEPAKKAPATPVPAIKSDSFTGEAKPDPVEGNLPAYSAAQESLIAALKKQSAAIAGTK